jgi:hypothetical protein
VSSLFWCVEGVASVCVRFEIHKRIRPYTSRSLQESLLPRESCVKLRAKLSQESLSTMTQIDDS